MNILFSIMGILGLVFTDVSYAQQSESRTALLIGISNYSDPTVDVLRGVPADLINAQSIAHAMGIPDQNIVTLRDEQATKAGILRALRYLSDRTAEGSRTFIYYSGHGTRWQDPQSQSCTEGLYSYDLQTLTNKEIAAATKTLSNKADKLISMVDACFSAGVTPKLTRSLNGESITAKFVSKGPESLCAATNTRSLLGETTRLGALAENLVHIASSRANEVSWDLGPKGSVATVAFSKCLLGGARDTDGSGAVSMKEVEECAQRDVNFSLFLRAEQHVSVTGTRNLIPVARPPAPPTAVAQTPVKEPAPQIVAVAAPPAPPIKIESITPAKPEPLKAPAKPAQQVPSAAPASTNMAASATSLAALKPEQIKPEPAQPTPPLTPPPKPQVAAQQVAAVVVTTVPAPALPPIKPEPVKVDPIPAQTNLVSTITFQEPVKPPPPALASFATLMDIKQQSNPKRQVKVSMNKPVMKIGKDGLDITVKSNHDGYLYLVLLGSDAKSFYILFPNGLDRDNKIEAGKPIRIPKENWAVKAAGPAGTDRILALVTDTPRKLDGLRLEAPIAAKPFTYALNDLGGRAALIDYLTGAGKEAGSESFGAALFDVREVK